MHINETRILSRILNRKTFICIYFLFPFYKKKRSTYWAAAIFTNSYAIVAFNLSLRTQMDL